MRTTFAPSLSLHGEEKSMLFKATRFELGEGDGTLLQYSCLENPMDGGAWWAAVYGVTESDTTEATQQQQQQHQV